MSLVGLPLILLTWALAIGAVAATVRGWRLAGRWRMPVRIVGLVVVEALVVAGAGLIVNRQDSFYPSWQALGGAASVVTVPSTSAGRLDGTLDSHAAVTWSPPEAAAWHLAAAPQLIAPSDYAATPARTFPVILVLTTTTEAAEIRPAAGALTVALAPTADTTVAALADLSGRLARDARVTDRLVILADGPWASLAAGWPGRPPVIAGHTAADFERATRDLPAPLAAPEELPS
ncbi:hypothetical protein [Paractinoplanes durhamensis]|uniref:Uncharacterized protein n=1 Tax=Paractinoplanes durhamensis TaxID=113563 RepID=A0ABQ3YN33_9ACTN|nr:hypothetical protein [Actinoplanes durhamensis]GID98976.1 hypothetical protein Adu01nite_03270 [Actinoplanes durhamensis]